MKTKLYKIISFSSGKIRTLFFLMTFLLMTCLFETSENVQALTTEQLLEFGSEESCSNFQYYGEHEQNKTLLIEGDNITTSVKNPDNPKDGLFVSGTQKDLKNARFTIKNYYYFSPLSTTMVRIDALAEHAKKVMLHVYLDGSDTPFVSTQINTQKETDNWDSCTPKFVEIKDFNLNETHYFSIGIEDLTSDDDETTKVLIRGIKFYPKYLPSLNINIDETLGTIDAMNSSEDHSTECYGNIDFSLPPTDYYPDQFYGNSEYLDTAGSYKIEYIRGRGNSTWTTTKKPYKIKLKKKADLFGMGKSKHWLLIANYFDPSLIRNRLTYYLGDELGMEFTPKLVPLDVFMNGKYLGSYYLCQQIRVDKAGVNINDLENISSDDENITGGYLLALSPTLKNTNYKFTTDYKMEFCLDSPAELADDSISENLLGKMQDYIKNYVQDTEDAIFGEDFKNADGVSYTDFLDMESAAKYFLIQSFTLNGDAYLTSSTYLYKKQDGKLYWGPIWDYDFNAFLYKKSNDEYHYTGFGNNNPWMNKLCQDENFRNEIKKVWGGPDNDDPSTLYNRLNEAIKEDGIIDQYYEQTKYSADANYDSPLTSNFIIGNENSEDSENNGEVNPNACNLDNYKEELTQLKNWIKLRMDWYDENLDKLQEYMLPDKMVSVNFYDNDTLLETFVTKANSHIDKTLPIPAREGYVFDGWYGTYKYIDENDEMKTIEGEITGSIIVCEDINAYAKWIPIEEYPVTKEIVCMTDTIYAKPYSYITFPYELLDKDAANNKVYITSDSEDVNIYSNDEIICTADYLETNITITTADGLSKTFKLIVNEYLSVPTDLTVSESDVELDVGSYKKINFTFTPSNVETKHLKILNLNPEVAYLSEAGVIHAKGAGTTTIYISYDGLNNFVPISVTVNGSKETANPDLTPIPEGTSNSSESGPVSDVIKVPTSLTNTPTVSSAATYSATTKIAPTVVQKDATFTDGLLCYKVLSAGLASSEVVTGGTVCVTGYTTMNGKKLKKITIPSTVTIFNNTFSVTKIGNKAFKKCKSLKKITIGENVKKIKKNSFKGCKKLKKIIFNSNECSFSKNSFKGIKKNAKFVVPKISFKAYKKALKKAGIKEKNIKGV